MDHFPHMANGVRWPRWPIGLLSLRARPPTSTRTWPVRGCDPLIADMFLTLPDRRCFLIPGLGPSCFELSMSRGSSWLFSAIRLVGPGQLLHSPRPFETFIMYCISSDPQWTEFGGIANPGISMLTILARSATADSQWVFHLDPPHQLIP